MLRGSAGRSALALRVLHAFQLKHPRDPRLTLLDSVDGAVDVYSFPDPPDDVMSSINAFATTFGIRLTTSKSKQHAVVRMLSPLARWMATSQLFRHSESIRELGSLLMECLASGLRQFCDGDEACLYFVPCFGGEAQGDFRIFTPTLVDNPISPGDSICQLGTKCTCNALRARLRAVVEGQVLTMDACSDLLPIDLATDEARQCAEALACALGMRVVQVQNMLELEGYVLTRDFACKFLELHMRRAARVPVVIEGESGTGKSRLLLTYARLLLESDTVRPPLMRRLFDHMREKLVTYKVACRVPHVETVKQDNAQVGAQVRRGPDWEWGEQDGPGGGVIMRVLHDGWVDVRWTGSPLDVRYRIGAQGKFDLSLVARAPHIAPSCGDIEALLDTLLYDGFSIDGLKTMLLDPILLNELAGKSLFTHNDLLQFLLEQVKECTKIARSLRKHGLAGDLSNPELYAVAVFAHSHTTSVEAGSDFQHQMCALIRDRNMSAITSMKDYLHFLMAGFTRIGAKNTVAYCGVGASSRAPLQQRPYGLGEDIVWSGFLIATTDVEAAKEAAGDGGVVMRLQKRSAPDISHIALQLEVVVLPNTRFEVVGEVQRDALLGVDTLDLRELEAEDGNDSEEF